MKHLLSQFPKSSFARHAAWMLFFNLLSRGVGMIGSGYAARCLGPEYLGISAVVVNFAQQGLLASNGGFDTVAVREIARAPGDVGRITRTVTTFRLAAGVILSVLWICAAPFVAPAIPLWVKWMGIPLLLLGETTLSFAFQGLEHFPTQTAITASISVVAALGYLLFFHPSMPIGSDLIVSCVAGLVGCVGAVFFFVRLTGCSPFGRTKGAELIRLIKLSWRYWFTGAATFIYYSLQIPIIAHFLGAREAGIFRSVMLLVAGVDLLYSSATGLLLPRLIAWSRDGIPALLRRQIRLTMVYFWIALIFTVLLVAGSPVLYHLLFGIQYEEGIPVFRIMVLGRAISFLGQIYANGLISLHYDIDFLAITLLGAGASLFLNLSLIQTHGIMGIAWISVAVEGLLTTLFLFASLHRYRHASSLS